MTLGATNATQADTTPPVISSTTIDRHKVVITYTDASRLNPNRVPPLSYYELLINRPDKIGNERYNFTSVTVDAQAKTVTLTLPFEMPDPASEVSAYLAFHGTPVIEDEAGNKEPTIGSRTLTNLSDYTAPVLITQGAEAPRVNGRQLTLGYSDARELASVVPAGTAFTVRVNGESVAVTEVAATGKNVTLTLATAVIHRQTVSVSYADPSGHNDLYAVQDVSGNDAASFAAVPVTNNTPDITAPVLGTASILGKLLTLDYTETSQLVGDAVPATAFSVLVNGVAVAVTHVDMSAASDNRVTLTLANPVANPLANPVAGSDRVTLAYTRPAGGFAIRDTEGNVADSFAAREVSHQPDTTPPVLLTTGAGAPRVSGNQLWLDYADANDLGPDVPAVAAFTVHVDGAAVPVTTVAVAGKTVTLTLASAVAPNQTVSISYTDPGSGDDRNAIQDMGGNDAASFAQQSVIHAPTPTPAPTPPAPTPTPGTDNTPPALLTRGANAPKVDGRQLVLHYTDTGNLGAAAVTAGAFTVHIGDSVIGVIGVTGVAVDPVAKTVTLTLASAVTHGQMLTVSYTDPTAGNDPDAVQDAAGNDAASFSHQAVTNNTPEATPPLLVTTGAEAPRVHADQLLLTYTDDLGTGAAAPPATAFTVFVDNVSTAVSAVAVAGKTVTLTLASAVAHGQRVIASYTDPGSRDDVSAIQDAIGNDADSFANQIVTNNTPPPAAPTTDTTAPVLSSATINGNQLVLGYTDESRLDADGVPHPTYYRPLVDAVDNRVTHVAVNADAKTVTLTLTRPAAESARVSLTYDPNPLGARFVPPSYIDLPRVRDTAGNQAAFFAARPVNNVMDSAPPVLLTQGENAPRVDGDRLVLGYSDRNNLGTTGPAATAFAVRVDGAVNTVTGVVVDAAAKTVTLKLTTPVAHGQTVSVGYTDPSAGNDEAAVQDAIGNDAPSFAPRPVANNTPEATPPTLVTEGATAPRVDGDQLILNFSDSNHLGAAGPATTAFTVYVGNTVNTVNATAVDPVAKTVTLRLGTPVGPGQLVTVSYTDPSSRDDLNAIQDAIGNDAASFTNQPVRSDTRDTTPPVLVTEGIHAPRINANQLVLNYTDSIDLGTGAAAPPASAFTVRVNGATAVTAITAVTVAGKTVMLTLAASVAPDEPVTVSYTDPTGNDDAAAIQDAVGNDAASFTNQPVIADNIPPVLVTTGPNAPRISGDQLVLNYSDTSNLGAGAAAPLPAAFTVRVNGAATAATTVTAVAVAGTTVTLTLASSVTPAQTVTVSYTDPGTGDDAAAVQDTLGSDAASFTNAPVRNLTDTTAPVLSEATITGDSLRLGYTEATMLNRGTVPASAFRVHVSGPVSGAAVVDLARAELTGDNQITLTLARAVAEGETVTLDYVRPTSGFVIEDLAGNDASSFRGRAVDNRTDTAPPALVTQGANAPRVDGKQLVLHYTDTSHLGATGPADTAFTVRVNDTANAVTRTVVDPVANTVTLTLTNAVTHGQRVSVSYTDPGAGNDEAAVQDSIGNDAVSFAQQAVANNTPETSPPVLVTEGAGAPRVNANRLVLNFTDASDLAAGAAAPLPAAFTVSVNKVTAAVTAVAVAGKTVTLTLASAVAHGQPVTVSYTDPGSRDDANAIQDAAGNDAASFANQFVSNDTPAPAPRSSALIAGDTVPPVLTSLSIDGNELVLRYTDANRLDTANYPGPEHFVVRVNGVESPIRAVAVSGGDKTVKLTLWTPVTQGAVVTLSYNWVAGGLRFPGATGVDKLGDVAGNHAAFFNSEPVNNLTDSNPPELITTGPNAPGVDGDRLVLNYNDDHHLGADGPPATAFTVRVGNTLNAVTGVLVNAAARTVTLTLATPVTQGQTVTVGYTDPTSGNDARAIQDASGNDAASFAPRLVSNNTPETTPPVLVTEGAQAPRVDGDQLVLNFSDDSSLGATGPAATAFTVRVGNTLDAAVSAVHAVTAVTVNPAAKTVTLRLGTPVGPGQPVTVSYTDPGSRDDANAIQDAAGNDAASFTNQPVRNDTRDTMSPVLVTEGANAPRVDGHQLVLLHYTDASDLSAAEPAAAAFTVQVNGVVNPVTRVVLDASTRVVTLMLTTPVAYGQTVTVSYTDPSISNDIHALQDAAGNDAASFTNQPVRNDTHDTTPPVLVITGANAPRVKAKLLALNYSDALNLGTGAATPPATAFTVRVDDAAVAVTAVSVAGKTVTLTLAASVESDQAVSVSYTDPTGNDDAAAIQDAAGNDAASFANQSVSVDNIPPVLVITGPNAPKVSGDQLVLNYSDTSNLGTGAAAPPASAFTVRVDGAITAVTAVTAVVVAGKTVTLTLARSVTPAQVVTVSYTDPGTGDDAAAIQDVIGSDAASFTNEPVRNLTDATAPVLREATITGDSLLLSYTEATMLNRGTVPTSAFRVHVNGVNGVNDSTVVDVARAELTDERQIRLTLARPVTEGDTVSLDYTRPASGFVIEDVAGNDADSFQGRAVDNRTDAAPPVLVTTGANAPRVDGRQLVLHYTDTNHLSAIGPASTTFLVRVNEVANAVTRTDVDPVAKTVTLTLTDAVVHGQRVVVDYTDPGAGNDEAAVQDAAGNDAASFADRSVSNHTPEATPPVLVTTGPGAPKVSADRLVLTYADTSNLGAAAPLPTAFTVSVNNAATPVTRVAVAGKTVTLTLVREVAHGQPVTVSYTDPSSRDDLHAIQDATGNDAASFANQSVINNAPAPRLPPPPPPRTDTTPPVFHSATIKGRTIVLYYSDESRLNPAIAPSNASYSMRIDYTPNVWIYNTAVVNGDARTVTLTMDSTSKERHMVFIRYLGQPLYPQLQDVAGNLAAPFDDFVPVLNLTDNTLPVLVIAGPNAPRVDGDRLVLSYTDRNNLNAVGPLATAFTVRVDGGVNAVTGVVVDVAAKTVTLLLTTAVVHGQVVTVGYTDPTTANDALAIQDADGNDAPSFEPRSVTNNTPEARPPVLVTTGVEAPRVNANQLVLNFSDDNHLDAATGPLATAFTVRVGNTANAVTAVTVDPATRSVTLTLASAVTHGQTVTVSYADPSSRDDLNAIQDAIGNDAASFAIQPVRNNTPDTTPPALVIQGANAPRVDGGLLVLHYTSDGDLGAIGPRAAAFTVRVDGGVNAVTRAALDPVGKTVTLLLTTAVTHDQTVTVSYTDPSAGNDEAALQDAAGNDAASVTNQPVTNHTPAPSTPIPAADNRPPVLVTTGTDAPAIDGDRLVLHYTDASDLGTGAAAPPAAAFAVRVNDVVTPLSTVTTVAVSGKTVTLTLASAVMPGQTVAVSYTDPTRNNDAAAVQDAAGNDAASFTNQPVRNNTQDTTPPELVTTGTDAPAVNGDRLVLHYTDASDGDLGTGAAAPPAAAFAVRVNNVVTPLSTVSAVAVSGKTVTLTLASAVTHGQTVIVSYTDPTGNDNNDAAAVQDAAGNDAISFTNQPVQNNTPDTTPPELVTTGTDAPAVDGDRLVLHYTDAASDLGTGAAAPPAAAFAVRVDNVVSTATVTAVTVTGKTVTLTLASAVTHGQTVTVSYTDPTGNDTNDAAAVQDAAGNDAISFTNQSVTNNTPDTTPPVLLTTGVDAPAVNGDRLVLHYTDDSDGDLGTGAAAPPATAFAVRVNNLVTAVTAVAVLGKTVTLTLASAVTHGQMVAVSYTDPTGNNTNDAAAVQDAAGNDAISFTNQPVQNNTPDTTAPELLTTGTDAPAVNGNRLVLHYADAGDLGAGAAAPPAEAFAVRVNDVVTAVTAVAVLGKTVTLTLATAVTHGQTVTVSYTDPTPSLDDSSAIQDAAGNDAASFTNQSVRNNTPDTTPPVLVTTGTDAPKVNGNQLVLTYEDANHLRTTGPDAEAFAVHVNGVVNAVTGVAVNPTAKTVTLTLTSAVAHAQTVTVSYTDPTPDLNDSSVIQDAAGNDAASFTNQPVRNNTPDTTAPVLVTTGANAPKVDGNQLVLTYDDANDLGGSANAPQPGAFTVQVDGVTSSVIGVSITGKTVTLTLATAVNVGQRVSVSYTDPGIGNDAQAVQDTAGNDAASFTSLSVTNNTQDTTAPALITTGANAPKVDGNQLVLTYEDITDLGGGTNAPLPGAFTVQVDGVTSSVSRVSITGKTVTLTLATEVNAGQRVSVSYTDPGIGNDAQAVQDTAGNDAASFTRQPVSNNTAAPPDTEPPVTESPTTQTSTSTSTATAPNSSPGVPAIQEDQIPGLARPGGAAPVAGDGNGDGIRDSLQSTVASMNGVTLVVTGQNGKPLADTNVRISSMEQKAAPVDLPKGLEMPMGLLNFAAQPLVTAGGTESFSLYVDPARGINGYWVKGVQDNTVVWVNLASEPYGGQMVTEGNRLRLDFKITDGGPFDADGQVDGSIAVLGAAGHMQLSIVGHKPDLAHGGFWF